MSLSSLSQEQKNTILGWFEAANIRAEFTFDGNFLAVNRDDMVNGCPHEGVTESEAYRMALRDLREILTHMGDPSLFWNGKTDDVMFLDVLSNQTGEI